MTLGDVLKAIIDDQPLEFQSCLDKKVWIKATPEANLTMVRSLVSKGYKITEETLRPYRCQQKSNCS